MHPNLSQVKPNKEYLDQHGPTQNIVTKKLVCKTKPG